MTLSEKVLYHQIHPAKLGTDISSELASLYFLWERQLGLGLATHFLPPIVASVILISFGHFESQKNSKFGRYIRWHMTRAIEAIRLLGDVMMAVAAWYHSPILIALGLLIVLTAWGSGPVRRHGVQ